MKQQDLNFPNKKKLEAIEENLKNNGRQLTMKFTITNFTKAKQWVWKFGKHSDLGIDITGLSNGDMFAEKEIMEGALEEIAEGYGKDAETAQEALDEVDRLNG
jgi:hypothetical protein